MTTSILLNLMAAGAALAALATSTRLALSIRRHPSSDEAAAAQKSRAR